jgi:hypothetical protein
LAGGKWFCREKEVSVAPEMPADFVIVPRGGNAVTTHVKTISLPRFPMVTASLCAMPLVTGCFETKDEFTLDPMARAR